MAPTSASMQAQMHILLLFDNVVVVLVDDKGLGKGALLAQEVRVPTHISI